MPPHLHPRSTATSTLFAGTLLASFIVVGIPHVFPCPRPRKGYADSERHLQLDADGKPVVVPARSKPSPALASKAESSKLASSDSKKASLLHHQTDLQEEATLFRQLQMEAEMLDKEARECPVPKPGGLIGRWLGFDEGKPKQTQKQSPEKS